MTKEQKTKKSATQKNNLALQTNFIETTVMEVPNDIQMTKKIFKKNNWLKYYKLYIDMLFQKA